MDAPSAPPPNPGRLLELQVADDPSAWAAAGFAVDGDRTVIDPVVIRLTGVPVDGGPRGITGWTLDGVRAEDGSLDGLATQVGTENGDPPGPDGPHPVHPNGTVGLDHVVVLTPDLDRTIRACEAAGLELRRIRETTANGSPMRQAFFKLGPVVLEVISGDVGTGLPASEAPATFWGLAVDADDLDETAARLGSGIGRIKVAVQRGRRIGTIRTKDLGISVAVAAMDHHADRAAPSADRSSSEGAR